MIIFECEQLSEEWVQARVGLPTASNFDKIITTKGELSTQSKKFMYQLAGERIIGKKEDSYTNSHMERGIAMEDEARGYYELINNVSIDTVGLCYKDDKKLFSCSPDGLIGNDGGIEIKCPSLSVHVEYLLQNKLPSTYFQQIQGNLYITDRKWWDFMSYYPGMPPLIIRVKRDNEFIEKMEKELIAFCSKLDEIEEKISEMI